MAERTGYLGLGSNVGDREHNLARALELLPDHGVDVEAVSSLYETEPVGEILDQPDFLNLVARVTTGLEPLDLLDTCKAVEVELGRMFGGPRHGPRPIDVDVLILGDLEVENERLDAAPRRGQHPAVRPRAAARARSRRRAAGRDSPGGLRRRPGPGSAGGARGIAPALSAQAGAVARSGSSHSAGRMGGTSPG